MLMPGFFGLVREQHWRRRDNIERMQSAAVSASRRYSN
jgi:hypothetical protein